MARFRTKYVLTIACSQGAAPLIQKQLKQKKNNWVFYEGIGIKLPIPLPGDLPADFNDAKKTLGRLPRVIASTYMHSSSEDSPRKPGGGHAVDKKWRSDTIL